MCRKKPLTIKDRAPWNPLLSPAAMVTDSGVVLTKSEDVFMVLRLSGVDDECLEPEQVESVLQRYDAALRTLGSEYRVYTYLMKRSSPDVQIPPVDLPLHEHRSAWLQDRLPRLYSIELYLAVLLKAPKIKASVADNVRSIFSVREAIVLRRSELQRKCQDLELAVESVVVQLGSTVRPKSLGRAGTLRFLRRLVNVSNWKCEVLGEVEDYHLDQEMGMSEILSFETHLKQDGHFIKVLSMMDPPGMRSPHILRGLLAIPCDMHVCVEWDRYSPSLALRVIERTIQHYERAKVRIQWLLGGREPKPHEVSVDKSKIAVVDQLAEVQTEIEIRGSYLGLCSLTISLYHTQERELLRAVAKVHEVFATPGGRILEEGWNLVNALVGPVPGNYAKSLRPVKLLNTAYTDLSMLFSPRSGNPWNEHLKAPCLGVLETNAGTPYYLNLHVRSVGHTAIWGTTDSGKTFTCNWLINGFQQYGPYTYIFDVGGGYKALTREYGGAYTHIGKTWDTPINPFSLPATAENFEFLRSFLLVLLEGRNGSLTIGERDDLMRQIENIYSEDFEPSARRLSTFARMVRKSYQSRFKEWIGDGLFARYFDNAEDKLTFARFQSFDFEGMDRKEVLEPLLFYVLHRANSVIYDPALQAVPKLVVLDEAWKFFANPITCAYVKEGFKTFRKRNAVMMIATQSADDLLRSDLLPAVVENCPTNIFLAHPGMRIEDYRETFHLNSTELDHIRRLTPAQQFLLRQSGKSNVLNLYVSEEERRVFGNEIVNTPSVDGSGAGRA